ncbi:MAG: diaminopimelate epimerase [Bacteroidales bacterium]|nr:diaminopimelate epimerase [Bacteroidales bacterium]
MNKISFYKYQGAGNDFVMIDNRSGVYNKLNADGITALCNRKYGVGADGVILLEAEPQPHKSMAGERNNATNEPNDTTGKSSEVLSECNENAADRQLLKMRYYNADGSEASFCGNGGRCFALFAHHLGLSKQCKGVAFVTFIAGDGKHEAAVYSEKRVQISMRSVQSIDVCNSYGNTLTTLDTGVPHGVIFTQSLNTCNVVENGRKIRNDRQFPEGINVDFVERISSNNIRLRTYERGVENETDACGTGAVAAAIATAVTESSDNNNVRITCSDADNIRADNIDIATHSDKKYLKDFGMYEVNVETKTAMLKVYFTLGSDNGSDSNSDGNSDNNSAKHTKSAKDIILEGPATRVFKGEIMIINE